IRIIRDAGGVAKPREHTGEIQVTARARFILEDVAHRSKDVDPKLEAVWPFFPGEGVIQLVEHGHLGLRQKIRRAKVTVIDKCGERYAAADGRIAGYAGHKLSCRLSQIERLLLPIG